MWPLQSSWYRFHEDPCRDISFLVQNIPGDISIFVNLKEYLREKHEIRNFETQFHESVQNLT